MFLILALVLPALVTIGIAISPLWPLTEGSYSSKQTNYKRLGIFCLSSYIMAGIVSGIMYYCAHQAIFDKEVWHFKIVGIRYEEKWTTEESYTVTIDDGDTTDSEGHTHHHSHTETRYRTDTHGPYWNAIDEVNHEHSIDPACYDHWASVWKNQKLAGIHNGSAAGCDRPITGKIFLANWTHKFDTIFPWCEFHTYENRPRHCNSVFQFKEPTKELEELYPRPAQVNNDAAIISYGPMVQGSEALYIERVNALLGPKYLIHTMLILFSKDADRSRVDDVLCAWRGVNKNELVTFAAIENGKVKWCEVHSWMDNTTIHGNIADGMMKTNFDIVAYGDLLMKYVPKQWQKKNFHDFDYLRVELGIGWKIAALALILLGMFGIYFFVDDKIDDYSRYGRYY